MANLISDHKKGTTWDGISFTLEELNEDGITLDLVNLTGVEITADFKYYKSRCVVFSFKTSDASILIPNPVNGTFVFTDRIINFPESVYFFTIQIKYPDGSIEQIIQDYWKIY